VTSAVRSIRGWNSSNSRSQTAGFNIHSGMAICIWSGHFTITTGPLLVRRRYRMTVTSNPYKG
jgi:hypothetical protein